MPPRNKVMLLPDHTRRELDNRLVNGGFSGYEALEDWLAEQGFEIGKSSLHRYGTDLSRRMAAVKASTEAAVLIADSCQDDEDKRSGAILSLVQTELFNSLVALQDADNEEESPGDRLALLAKAGKGIADIVKASGGQKKWQVEVRKAAREELIREQREKLDALGKSGEVDQVLLAKVIKAAYGLEA